MSKRFECEYNWIIDNNKRNTKESLIVYDEEWNTLNDLCELLNQLQQRIEELENQLKNRKDFCINQVRTLLDLNNNLIEENQQLKQTIQTMRQNVRNGSLEDAKYMEALKEEINDLKDSNISIFEYSKKVEQENQQLKQQLHDLPKKIVEDVSYELGDCGKTYLEDEPYIGFRMVKYVLLAILKKY